MTELIFARHAAEVRDIDIAKRQLTMVISTEVRSRRDGHIIEVAGWDLDAYKKNPVVLFAHNYGQPAVGKSVKMWTENKALVSRTEFAPTELGMELWALYSQGYMRATSVGFRPIEKMRIEEDNEKGEWPSVSYRFKRQELLEYSLVPVPADAGALAKAKVEGLRVAEVERAMAETADVDAERPYPNEHACRLKDPGQYDTCRRGTRKHDGKTFSVIYCKKGDGPMEEQAYRYPKATWTAAEARSHCKAHDGSFEAATEKAAVSQAEMADELDYAREIIGQVGLSEGVKPLARQLLEVLVREIGDDTAVEDMGLVRGSYELVVQAKTLLEQVLEGVPQEEAPRSLDITALAEALASELHLSIGG